jgi:hypothetical protein
VAVLYHDVIFTLPHVAPSRLLLHPRSCTVHRGSLALASRGPAHNLAHNMELCVSTADRC